VRPPAAVAVFTLIVGAAMAGGALQTRTGGGAGRASKAAAESPAIEGAAGETDHAAAPAPGTSPTSRSAAAPPAGAEKGAGGSQTASVDPQSITGMMTVDEVAQTFGLKPADIPAALHAPKTEDPSRPLREIAHQYGTEVSALREWPAGRPSSDGSFPARAAQTVRSPEWRPASATSSLKRGSSSRPGSAGTPFTTVLGTWLTW